VILKELAIYKNKVDWSAINFISITEMTCFDEFLASLNCYLLNFDFFSAQKYMLKEYLSKSSK